MPIVRKRPRAFSDLADIWDYIAEDSEERADAFVATIDGKIRILASHPLMGRPRDELVSDLRRWPVGSDVIFYRPLADGVDIIRVLHGAREIEVAFHADD